MTWRRNGKYNAKKTEVDGIIFDSKGEAGLYKDLQMLLNAGLIEKVERQVPFKLYAGIKYVADFVVTVKGSKRVLDFKGIFTPEFRLKKKLFEADHGKLEVVTTESGWKP